MDNPNNWEIKDLLALSLLKGLDFNTQKRITELYPDWSDFLDKPLLPEISFKLKNPELFDSDDNYINRQLEKQLESAENNNSKIISFFDDDYPEMLKEIHNPPLVLFVKGNIQNHGRKIISMVGTRRCTTYGRLTAERFAEFFASHDIAIVSGMAYGIDSISHKSAIKTGGKTYAVVAHGLDCFSGTAKSIMEEIIESGGAVISNYYYGILAKPPYFLQRNRLISGMSAATIVIESAVKGGSMNTASHAFEQSREVYAVPGNITQAKSRGANLLIKKNIAIPALSPEDVLKELKLNIQNMKLFDKKAVNFKNGQEKSIYNNLSFDPVHIDEIPQKTGMNISEVLVTLMEMEFKGLVRQLPGKYYVLQQ